MDLASPWCDAGDEMSARGAKTSRFTPFQCPELDEQAME